MVARHNFRKLMIWKEGIELAKETYSTTKKFPKHEIYGIANQMQRSAVSIPSNIAEGTAKSTDKHFLQYLETALSSAYEWETQLIISYEIGNISKETYKDLVIKIQKTQGMITRFMESLSH